MMLRCSPEAFAKCPTRHICGSIQEATFTEGSECDLFNQSVAAMPMSNGDWIRAMSDEELAHFQARRIVSESQMRLEEAGYAPTATQMTDLHARLYRMWLAWLQEPAKEDV